MQLQRHSLQTEGGLRVELQVVPHQLERTIGENVCFQERLRDTSRSAMVHQRLP
jgi:hypothetical protein